MASVTQTIPNYLSGVSKQADSKKIPGQVRECLNGFPDVTLGLTKRPGFKFISKLKNGSGTDFSGTQLDGAKWFYINRSTTKYIGCITPKVGGTNGTIHVWNADTGAVCTITDKTTNAAIGAHGYLTGVKSNYDVLTVDAATFITNDTVTVTTQAAPTFVAASRGTLLLTGTPAEMLSTSWEVKLGGTAILAEKSAVQVCTASSDSDDKYEDVLTKIKDAIDAKSITGMTVTKYATSLQLDYVLDVGGTDTLTPFTLEAKGGDDNERLVVFQDYALDHPFLPPNSFHNHIVTINKNTKHSADDYYAQFVADNGAGGSGYWKETRAPDVSPGLTKSTMPHRLVNTGATTFDFEEVPWEDRLVGSDVTNPHPSFVGKTIKKLFFHDARLGFLSEDNVILSQAIKPFNLYRISARTFDSGDRVDRNCASLRPCKLFSVKPFRQGLVLFAKNQQFLMYGEDNGQIDKDAKIAPMSNMEMSDDVEPIDIGTHMNFISKTPNFVRVFAMTTKGLGESPDILDIGRVVNEWITIDVDTFVASVQNEFIAMASQSSNEIYFYKTYSNGQELLMESWFKWSLPGTIQGLALDQDDMYCVTKQVPDATDATKNQYTISKSNLTQSPEVAIITNAQGQKINPCMDLYAQASSVAYDSTNLFSKCYLPYANLTDQKNVLIIAGTTAAGTYNNSGFTITPEVGTDGTGTYFKVPGQDLTTNASNVYVGYAYDLDVTLPQVHYQLDQEGKNVDYTASLTIARCKFDVGLSGVMGFKLKTTGRLAGSKTHTGDGSNKKFKWTVSDLDYVDRNQVQVKVNNVTNTAFTFLSNTEIEFTTAPANNSTVLIYVDEWYQLQPVTSADIYLADDVALNESTVFTLPIHQRSKNFTLRVFNDSPFPVSLNSMMWEGNYSPRFYRRT